MGIITKGMGAVLKHIKKSGRSITKAGDKWHAKTTKLQRSKKKIEKIKGAARIIVPMTGAAVAGGALPVVRHPARWQLSQVIERPVVA